MLKPTHSRRRNSTRTSTTPLKKHVSATNLLPAGFTSMQIATLFPRQYPNRYTLKCLRNSYNSGGSFKGNVLEDNFKILRKLTASQIYKAYLANTFPRDESFETLDEFWKVPPPPTEDFLRLFEGILENPADEQIAFIYRAMLAYKCFYSTDITARKCGGSVGG